MRKKLMNINNKKITKNKEPKENGITVLGLSIMIIIILILALITINVLSKDNGIISKTDTSKQIYEIGQYRDIMQVARESADAKKLDNKNVNYFGIIEEQVLKEKRITDDNVVIPNNQFIQITTKEGYVFKVTEKAINLIETKDIKFSQNNDGTITIERKNGNGIQYKKNNEKEWTTNIGTNTITETVSNGDTIYARPWDGKNAGPEIDLYIEREIVTLTIIKDEEILETYTGKLGEKKSITMPLDEVYTISFRTVEEKSIEGIEDIVTKSNFKGVYNDKNEKIKLTETKVPNTYIYTFGTSDAKIYLEFSNSDISLPKPNEKTGYIFKGWSESKNAEDILDEEKYTPNGSITLYGFWEAKEYTITADTKGGTIKATNGWTITNGIATKTVKYDSTYGAFPTLEKTGYIFQGWYTEDGTKLEEITKVQITGDQTIYAKWEKEIETYTIALDGQSATSVGTTEIYEKYGTEIYLDAGLTKAMTASANAITLPTKTGYTFGGYYTSTGGNGTQMITEKGYITSSFTTTKYSADTTLYAKWTAETYIIALDGQSATSAGTTAIYEIYGSKYSLTNDGTKAMSTTANAITAPTRTGYTFGGYYTEKNGGGTQYITDKGFLTTSASTTNFKAAGTLYAYWEDRIAPNVETTNSSVEYQQGQYVYLELASAIGTDSQTTSPSGGSVSVGLTTSLLYEIDIKNNMNLDEPWSEAYINNLDNYGTEYNIEYLDDYTADDEGFENAIYNLTDGLVCGYPKDSEYYDEAIKARIWEGIKFLRIDFDTAINLSGAEVYAQQHGNDNDSTSYGHWYYLGILASNEKHDKATGTNTVGFKKPCLTQKIGRAKAGVPLVVEADKTTTIEISYTDKGSGVTTIYGSNDNSSWTELISSSEGIETLAVAVEGLEGNGTYYFKAIDAKENESEAVGIPYGTNNGLLTLEENVSMKEGETKTLTASLTGEDGNLSDIEWESSDSDIITVTKGSNGEAILTAVGNKNETAIITAKIQINGIIYRAYCKAEILGADGIVYKIAKNNYNGIINIVANKSSYLTRVINVYDGGEGDDDGTVNGKITISSDKTYGDVKDCGTADSNAKRMVIVKYHGDVLIESGVTVTSVANEDGYGGPKGLYLCSTGTFENNGIISMTARGAKATGENVYLYSADRENWEYIPATGGAGGVGATITGNSSSLYYAEGDDGKPGTGRGTGGGGAGALSIGGTSKTNTSQPGTEGTSYSGGSGSGGISTYWYGIGNWSSYSAATAGGAGGMGVAAYGSSSSKITMNAGGGAGNPGQKGALVSTTAAYMDGSGFVFGGNNSSYKGSNGTGGLLIIYGNTVINKGTISSEGSSGGIGQTRTANGGSSGGGSINIFYANEYNNTEGKTNVEGGPSTGTLYNTTSISDENRQIPGGAGGSGTVTATKIDIE